MKIDFISVTSLVGLFISILIFYFHAVTVSRFPFTLRGFTIADQSVSKERFANTFAAGSLSLSTVFAFMLATAEAYGMWLVIAPITMFAGALILASFVRRGSVDIGTDYTQASFVLTKFGSRWLAGTISVITALSFLGTVFLELLFGSILLNLFFPDEFAYKVLSYLILAGLVLGYLRRGGYRVVLVTDTWQMALISIAFASLLILTITVPSEIGGEPQINAVLGAASIWEIFIFCAWITVLNLCQPFGRLSFWQRLASLDKDEDVVGVTFASWKKFFFVWAVPIMCFLILLVKGYSFSGLDSFFDFSLSREGLLNAVLFPLVYTGLASVLLSTIDTRLIAALTSLADSVTFGPVLEKLEKEDPDKLKKITTLVVAGAFIFLGAIYTISNLDYFGLLTTLINIIFNGLTILSPIIAYGVWVDEGKTSKKSVRALNKTWILLVGLIAGYTAIIYGAVYGYLIGSESVGQATLFGSLILVAISVGVFHLTVKREKSPLA